MRLTAVVTDDTAEVTEIVAGSGQPGDPADAAKVLVQEQRVVAELGEPGG